MTVVHCFELTTHSGCIAVSKNESCADPVGMLPYCDSLTIIGPWGKSYPSPYDLSGDWGMSYGVTGVTGGVNITGVDNITGIDILFDGRYQQAVIGSELPVLGQDYLSLSPGSSIQITFNTLITISILKLYVLPNGATISFTGLNVANETVEVCTTMSVGLGGAPWVWLGNTISTHALYCTVLWEAYNFPDSPDYDVICSADPLSANCLNWQVQTCTTITGAVSQVFGGVGGQYPGCTSICCIPQSPPREPIWNLNITVVGSIPLLIQEVVVMGYTSTILTPIPPNIFNGQIVTCFDELNMLRLLGPDREYYLQSGTFNYT